MSEQKNWYDTDQSDNNRSNNGYNTGSSGGDGNGYNNSNTGNNGGNGNGYNNSNTGNNGGDGNGYNNSTGNNGNNGNYYNGNSNSYVGNNSGYYYESGNNSYNNGYNNSYNNGYNNGYNDNRYGYAADPEGTNRKFAGVSFGFGIASLVLLWTGVLAVITGAVGTLFGVLSRRKGKGYPQRGRTGFIMSMVGMLTGLLMTIYSVFYVLVRVSPRELYQQIQNTYEQMYGEDFDPSQYGIDPDLYEYDSFMEYLEKNAGSLINK